MALSNKQSLINYIEFLKESGFLYMEGAGEEPDPQSVATHNPTRQPASAPETPKPEKPQPAQPARPAKGTMPAPATTPIAPAPVQTLAPGQPLSREERIARLAEIAARAEACRACPLGAQRNKLVFSDGDPMARLAFVGEAPGGEENATGVPFVGPAGQLLTKMIQAIGFKREEVYICNTVKCRPPGNRDPFPAEKAACEHFLVEQLEIVRPRILVALGSHAAQYLCKSEETIGRLRGRWHSYHGIPLLATYHPAFLLRNASNKPKSWEDFQAIHAKYTELNPDDPHTIWSRKEKDA
jgi:uracil-DNA glycosylase